MEISGLGQSVACVQLSTGRTVCSHCPNATLTVRLGNKDIFVLREGHRVRINPRRSLFRGLCAVACHAKKRVGPRRYRYRCFEGGTPRHPRRSKFDVKTEARCRRCRARFDIRAYFGGLA